MVVGIKILSWDPQKLFLGATKFFLATTRNQKHEKIFPADAVRKKKEKRKNKKKELKKDIKKVAMFRFSGIARVLNTENETC